MDKISLSAHNKLIKTQTLEGDILTARTGKVGGASIITKDFVGSNSNQNVVNIRITDNSIVPLFLVTFLNCKYGINQFIKASTGNVQPWLNLSLLRKVKIPIFLNNFQLNIEKLVNLAYSKLEDSKSLYKQSEELLLKELDLLNFKPSQEKVSIKSFNESFGESGRLDSEYYQPKYDEIIEHIKNVEFDSLYNIVNIKKSIEPGSDAYQEEGIPFIRVSNLTKFCLSTPDIHLSKDLFDDELLEVLQPKKDTILLSKDGTVGIAYNIKNEADFITSGALLHLTIKKDNVLPEYLTLVLNSIVVQMQSQRDAGGSIIKHWKPSEIAEVLIPIVDRDIQIQIEEKIKESFKLKEESKQLLEVAKRAVEIAIEEDELIAMEFIKNNN
ncbi:DNA methylase [Malaciobacter molluscorum]|nr:DNA methylase [Malaciobacter molluscorum]